MLHEQPLIPELEGYRNEFRWAKGEIRNLAQLADEQSFNQRPNPGAWSAAECVAHLVVSGRLTLPGIREGIRAGREGGRLAGGPFTYGRLGNWFVAQVGADELPPPRRLKVPRLYRPPQARHPVDESVRSFLELQDGLIETLQLASGLDLAGIRVRSPVTPLIRLGLGQWFRLLAGHQRRHLWQAAQALQPGRQQD